MKTIRALSLAVALLAGHTVAEAQTTDFRLTSAGNVVSGGVYVGPYRGVLGSGPGAPTIDVVCVDYFNHAQLNTTYQARTTNLGSGWNANNVRFGNAVPNSLLAYRQAAWLSWQFQNYEPALWGDIHRTIWNVFTTGAPDPMNSNLQTALLNAWNNWYNGAGQTFDWNSVVVITDTRVTGPAGGFQEFVTTTPEPATVVLLFTGLVFVLGVAVKRGGLLA